MFLLVWTDVFKLYWTEGWVCGNDVSVGADCSFVIGYLERVSIDCGDPVEYLCV